MSVSPQHRSLIDTVLHDLQEVQAIYLFGSYGTDDERPESDVDIAILLAPAQAKKVGLFALSAMHMALETLLHRPVDVINLRQVSTVLQKEVIAADRCIYRADPYAIDEFEMLTLSYYQQLHAERRDIVQAVLEGGRFYQL